MRYLKTFEGYKEESKNHSDKQYLIVVDVQKSFSSYYTDNYLKELNNYCNGFNVIQIFDNHHDKNPDMDYLYDKNPDIESKKDLYTFNNQVSLIEKRYNYDVNVDFYKKILSDKTYNIVKQKEDNKTIKRGELFNTKEGTAIVYIGNNHKWYHVGKKLYDLFKYLKGKDVIICGGSLGECLLDISVAGKSIGVNIIENKKFIYSSTNCPIK